MTIAAVMSCYWFYLQQLIIRRLLRQLTTRDLQLRDATVRLLSSELTKMSKKSRNIELRRS